ncbi:MAG: hypothetical protein GY788_13860 [bacterium]|nr:hypothetical protein [bacterium]
MNPGDEVRIQFWLHNMEETSSVDLSDLRLWLTVSPEAGQNLLLTATVVGANVHPSAATATVATGSPTIRLDAVDGSVRTRRPDLAGQYFTHSDSDRLFDEGAGLQIGAVSADLGLDEVTVTATYRVVSPS